MLFPPLFNALTSIARFTPGEMPLFGSDVCVPALLGMEYPDPMGSGLSVPVLGCQTDLVSGRITPLAGTMEDPDGKGKEENNKSPDIVHLKSTLRLYETIQNKDSCTLFFPCCAPQAWWQSVTRLRLSTPWRACWPQWLAPGLICPEKTLSRSRLPIGWRRPTKPIVCRWGSDSERLFA